MPGLYGYKMPNMAGWKDGRRTDTNRIAIWLAPLTLSAELKMWRFGYLVPAVCSQHPLGGALCVTLGTGLTSTWHARFWVFSVQGQNRPLCAVLTPHFLSKIWKYMVPISCFRKFFPLSTCICGMNAADQKCFWSLFEHTREHMVHGPFHFTLQSPKLILVIS